MLSAVQNKQLCLLDRVLTVGKWVHSPLHCTLPSRLPVKQLSPLISGRGQGCLTKLGICASPAQTPCDCSPELGRSLRWGVQQACSVRMCISLCWRLQELLQVGDWNLHPQLRACGGQVKGCQAGLLVLVASSFLFPQVNVMAVSICTREAYQSMKERNIDDGHIININRYAGGNVGSATWAFSSPPCSEDLSSGALTLEWAAGTQEGVFQGLQWVIFKPLFFNLCWSKCKKD